MVDPAASDRPLCPRDLDDLENLAHELWASAQLVPGEGIIDGVDRIVEVLAREYGVTGAGHGAVGALPAPADKPR